MRHPTVRVHLELVRGSRDAGAAVVAPRSEPCPRCGRPEAAAGSPLVVAVVLVVLGGSALGAIGLLLVSAMRSLP